MMLLARVKSTRTFAAYDWSNNATGFDIHGGDAGVAVDVTSGAGIGYIGVEFDAHPSFVIAVPEHYLELEEKPTSKIKLEPPICICKDLWAGCKCGAIKPYVPPR